MDSSDAVGPDRMAEANTYTCCDVEGYVRIRREPGDGPEPISVPSALKDAATGKSKNWTALAVKRGGDWKKWTYKQYYDDANTTAKGFIKLGLEPRKTVAILGFNAPEWFISEMGAISAGGISTGIYPTNGPDACKYILEDSRTNILVVEDEKQYAKIKAFRDELPHLKAVVMYGADPISENVVSWKRLQQIGKQDTDDELHQRLRNMAINECCHMVYTSGTTGPPKGVMLSHDNLTMTGQITYDTYDLDQQEGDRYVSYLPLSHVAANAVDVFASLKARFAVYFADKDALKGSLINTLREVRPTYFFAVPRVWEKFEEAMVAIGRKNTGVKKVLVDWAKRVGSEHNQKILEGNGVTSWRYLVANQLVYSTVKQSLGLDRVKKVASAAAPLSKETTEFFSSLDIRIIEIYGMSETCGPGCGTTLDHMKFGTIGRAMDHTEAKINEPGDDGVGELCIRGRSVMMGYKDKPEKTLETIDEDGWVRSGDLGKLDKQGFFAVTGRIKELLITSGGENIPPFLIEDNIKNELPNLLSNVFLVGDRRKFLTCLMTLRVEIDPKTEVPTNRLTEEAIEFCRSVGSKAETVDDIAGVDPTDNTIQEEIKKALQRANEDATSNAQRVQKFAVIPGDFSVATGELGPTLKIKRHVVLEKHSAIIEGFYN